ncbi:rhamnulokinase [Amphibacillus marinus]|uniref:Rhamnulokinase n=1 Tax=Amphibacillus marinus TaxID=872970 RepID=A0A1H8LAJ3_9BACI|nr:FGGY family carbohydrate kinase [Amphibacillus marinus]SEO02172.1 rhamnulokinase [Amphibacillus marinus]
MHTILAFDLGATSARGIVYRLDNCTLQEIEVYRFTGYQLVNQEQGEIRWDIDMIMNEIRTIIRMASTTYFIESIGFDSWGCDFGLINGAGELIRTPLCYQTMLQEKNLHYGMKLPDQFRQRTGIANASINTSSQLLYLKNNDPESLQEAEHLLMIPDLIHYLLTGSILTESSIASTSQLFDIKQQQWALDLIAEMDIPTKLFSTIVLPYTRVGTVKTGEHHIPIHSVMEHDTASAIYALPTNDHTSFFLSSGTWSVLGQKAESGLILRHPLEANYSYEQAGDGKILKLQNMLGMWFIEEALREVNQTKSISIQEVQRLLENEPPIGFFFDSQDDRFLSKGQFGSALRTYGKQHNLPLLDSTARLFLAIYQNLAFKYAATFADLIGENSKPIYLFGGGSKSDFLNQLTADLTQCTIAVCYSESSALGNALAQFLALKAIRTREELVLLVTASHPPTYFIPRRNQAYEQAYQCYQESLKELSAKNI